MLKDALARIPEGLPAHLSTSVPWSLYWCCHALDMLGERAWLRRAENKQRVLSTLRSCWSEVDGGFGGGPGLDAHACATYAAVCTLVILGDRQLPPWLDRQQLLLFLSRLKHGDRFHSTLDERVDDVRITYCTLAAASLIADGGDDGDNAHCRRLAAGCERFLDKLQSYEGGLTGTPDGEAHAGYTYCALAAAILAGLPEIYNTPKLLSWLSTRQTSIGGLQGRVNKLPDTCYTFWLGGTLAMLSDITVGSGQLPYDVSKLVKFVLACQSAEGGFSDHPLENPDLYHTCYAISGLAAIAEFLQKRPVLSEGQPLLLLRDNRLSKLAKLHPVYNICRGTLREWRD